MIRDAFHINDFMVITEFSSGEQASVDICTFDEPVVAIALYGSGNVDLTIKFGQKVLTENNTSGLALSFYADTNVIFEHHVSPNQPLHCVLIVTALRNLEQLPAQEGELFQEMLHQLVTPNDHFVEGPRFYMPPNMQVLAEQLFDIPYTGKAKMLFFKSHVVALLSHYFGQMALQPTSSIPEHERKKLQLAKEILSDNLETPPSLNELSRQIGLNTFKLKKNFKEVFGVPVFKYVQQIRLEKAHQLIKTKQLSVQEVAWDVGYESISSFSNAFAKKYGYRPSELNR
ncbi:MAG: helix-turn-helix transcriptional regulator [Balneolaceae bacterium]|nr:helix-turn-helix transcriptional regulator [Balneolaceae bacterium]